MVAATHLLDTGVRPRIGTLTVSFANVEAYATFDPAEPFESRQLVHNLNRIWSAELLEGSDDSPELRRARVLRPVVAAADHILDLHSTSQDVRAVLGLSGPCAQRRRGAGHRPCRPSTW
jgi:predicted deacylase